HQNYVNYLGPSPYFSRVGIYDRVLLEIHQGTYLTEAVIETSLNNSLTQGTVTVDAVGHSQESKIALQARLLDPDGTVVTETAGTASAPEGVFVKRLTLSLEKPQLWWPRGYGKQPLYRLQLLIMIEGRPHVTQERTIGFRRVTMARPLHFEVNHMPVRLWGGCWVTPRWDTAVWDTPRVEQLFAMAAHANFNALRVWGVVESPRNDFYERADTMGFMVWQDFTHLPLRDDTISRDICRQEATLMVKRLKHHPSVFVWCGGNENAMWHHQEFNGDLEDRGPWGGTETAQEVGDICKQLDPNRYYQPSSPFFGDNPNAPEAGNTHGYTNMWFVSGYDYLNFASEDTRIAAPPLPSLQQFMAPNDIWPADYSPVYTHGNIHPFPQSWLKYTTSSSWKKTGPVEQFYDPTNAADLVHRLGMAEALYYQDVIERQRRGRAATDPNGLRRCGGYLVWKYNDSWPQIYSAKVDYFLEPYHCYYALRRAYAPVMLSFDKGAYIHLWAVNDSSETVSGQVTLQLYHLHRNEIRKEYTQNVVILPGLSQVVVRLDRAGMHSFRREHTLFATLRDDHGQVLARTDALADIERRITFPDAKLDVQIREKTLTLSTDKYAHCVTLIGDAEGNALGWLFSDNYFNLFPGEVKTVHILGKHSQGTVTVKAQYSPHETSVVLP
ncbi:glycoside hydrolase family 2 protein, partial [Planctomycetota bacterium]